MDLFLYLTPAFQTKLNNLPLYNFMIIVPFLVLLLRLAAQFVLSTWGS